MRKITRWATAGILAISIAGGTELIVASQATAGVSSTAFAQDAKSGINQALISAYGSLKNSPWKVECSQKPMTETATAYSVVCHVTAKLCGAKSTGL